MLYLINLPYHPLLFELGLTLVDAHMALADLLYAELLPIRDGLGLVYAHLLHEIGASRCKLSRVAIFQKDRH